MLRRGKEVNYKMNKITILIDTYQQSKIFGKEDYERLAAIGDLHIYDRSDFQDKKYYIDFVKDSNLLILSWGSPKLDKDLLDACPALGGVIYGAGTLRRIMTDDFLKSGIPITDSKIIDSRSVAVTTLGVAIAACKGTYTLPNDVRNGLWRDNADKIKDFYKIKIGVIGASYAGRYFVELLQAFDVDVYLYDPTMSAEQIKALGAAKKELDELLSECDVISLHAPSLPETKNMINKSNLALIRDDAILINTARGALINEADLIEECRKNRFLVFLDVFMHEPVEADNPLRTFPNVICLPHVAGTYTNGVRAIGVHVCEEAERFIRGERMKCEVDLTKLHMLA